MRSALHSPVGQKATRRARVAAALAGAFVVALTGAPGALADSGPGSGSAFVPPTLAAAAEQTPVALFNVIVKGKKSVSSSAVALDEKSAMLEDPALGARVKKQYVVVNGTSATLSGKQIRKLAKHPHISSIVPDGRTGGLSFSNPQSWPVESQVSSFWTSAASPTIAVIDSGIDASRAADFGARVLTQTTFVSSGPNTAGGDGFGHGTLVASIAAGSADGYTGAAPGANLVSVDVLDNSGAGVESDLLSGLDWVYQNRAAYGIKVVNLSVLAGGESSFMYDALDQAVEKLWFSGVVVVTASGNYAINGEASGVLYSPANDPFVITVGAADAGSSSAPGDDFNAPWSAFGSTPDGFAKPELGAVGRYMNGAVPATATMASLLPDRIVEPGYMWMSGTSFAAPVVSGAAALLVALHPGWTPDQIKGALMLTAAQPASSAAGLSLGVGLVQAADAAAVSAPPNPNEGLNEFVVGDGSGGQIFDTASWSSAAEANASWSSASWSSASWSSASWSSASWSSASWSSASWSSASWSSASWSSASWSSASWSSASWSTASLIR